MLLYSEVLRKVIPAIWDLLEKNARCKTENPGDVIASKAPHMDLLNLVFSRIKNRKIIIEVFQCRLFSTHLVYVIQAIRMSTKPVYVRSHFQRLLLFKDNFVLHTARYIYYMSYTGLLAYLTVLRKKTPHAGIAQ
jgi:hypothetical protein